MKLPVTYNICSIFTVGGYAPDQMGSHHKSHWPIGPRLPKIKQPTLSLVVNAILFFALHAHLSRILPRHIRRTIMAMSG